MSGLAHLTGPKLQPPRYGSICAALDAAARSSIGLTFVDAREEERALPYAELADRARGVAFALADLGVRPGDRVALILPTGVGFMDAFFGALYAGAIPVPLYPPVRLGRLDEYHSRTASLLSACGARLLISDSRVGRLLGQTLEKARPELGSVNIGTLAEKARGRLSVPALGADLALIQFSSGTTVDPKPVALSHQNVLANVTAIDSFIPPGDAAQAGVSWLPLYHDMGLIGCLLEAVNHPGPLTLIPPELFLARPALWLRAISRKRATISVAPNFAFGLCLKRVRDEDLAGVDLSSWKLALNGAEPISPEVLRRFAARFAKFGFNERALTPVYGLSEASLAVTFCPPWRTARTVPAPDGKRELVSVGVPVPGSEVRIAGPDDATLALGAVGRVLVRGPSVMQGYFGRPDATAKAIREGWLDTGDLGFIASSSESDASPELFLCGRAKDLVILRGRNHAPHEFEESLEGIAGLRAGCAVALGAVLPGADSEELLLLAERDESGAPRDDDQVIQEVLGRVVERTGIRPHTVQLLSPGTLPRTSSGKLRRGEALRLWTSGELVPPKEVTVLGLLGETGKSLAAYARVKLSNLNQPKD